MVMAWQDAALAIAGAIGCFVSVFHGILTQRLMVRPVEAIVAGDRRVSAPVKRLIPPLLQFTTFNWFVGGLALIAAALWLGQDGRLAVGLLVGSSYLYAAVGNFWGTRGRHPGWMAMAAAVILIMLSAGSGEL
jgi:hypothetical protein